MSLTIGLIILVIAMVIPACLIYQEEKYHEYFSKKLTKILVIIGFILSVTLVIQGLHLFLIGYKFDPSDPQQISVIEFFYSSYRTRYIFEQFGPFIINSSKYLLVFFFGLSTWKNYLLLKGFDKNYPLTSSLFSKYYYKKKK